MFFSSCNTYYSNLFFPHKLFMLENKHLFIFNMYVDHILFINDTPQWNYKGYTLLVNALCGYHCFA